MKITRLLDWIILLIGIVSTSLATTYVYKKNLKEDQLRFDYETKAIIRRIQNRMQTYESALIELRAFLRNTPDFSKERIKSFIHDTQIIDRMPGLTGIGYAEIYRKNENYSSSVIILEPQNKRNQRALGFDMYAEPLRRKAMDEARDYNHAVMSDAVILVQENVGENFLGFNLYLPHYRKGADITTMEGKRKALLGFVYSPFRAGELFKAALQDVNLVLDVEIFQGEYAKNKVYFDSHPGEEEMKLVKFTEMMINGRKLIIRTAPLPDFGLASSKLKTSLVFIGGMFLTLILYYIYFITRKQIQIAHVATQEKEKLLQKEKEHVAARDDFLSIASHELKTPLTSLKLQAQVMLRAIAKKDQSVLTPERITNLVKQIDSQTTRLTRLVDDMLDISRIRTGRLKIEKETVDLTEVILDVVERLKPQFQNVTGEIPLLEIQQNIHGNWDRFRLEQVITNLLTNAIRYGNGKTVTVKTAVENTCAKICVIDQGIGIAKENRARIFDRFERAGMSANEVSGLGLGLYITNQIIKAHGGSIHVESEPGKGSTFIVELPLSDERQPVSKS